MSVRGIWHSFHATGPQLVRFLCARFFKITQGMPTVGPCTGNVLKIRKMGEWEESSLTHASPKMDCNKIPASAFIHCRILRRYSAQLGG